MNDPLAHDTVSINVMSGGHPIQMPGRVVTAGLAIIAVVDFDERRPRYILVHVPSGLTLGFVRCGEHIEHVAEVAVNLGVDWTTDPKSVVAALKTDDRIEKLAAGVQCRGRCDGDPPEGENWGARCTTCDWVWEDEYDEGPLDAQQAKRMVRDHECEPHVEILPPNGGQWLNPSQVNDDGTLRQPARLTDAVSGQAS